MNCIVDAKKKKTSMDKIGQRNCEQNDYVWRKDTGGLTNPDTLPVMSWCAGDTGDSGEQSRLELHTLACKLPKPAPKPLVFDGSTDCTGKEAGRYAIKPLGANGYLEVECDGHGGATVKKAAHDTGVHAGAEGECSGSYNSFTYAKAALSGQSESEAVEDIQRLVQASESCYQPYEMECNGSIMTNYHCLGDSKVKMTATAMSSHCDKNDGNYLDGGIVQDKGHLPITRWWYGDTGDADEDARLFVDSVVCYPKGYTASTSCKGQPAGPTKIRPVGASGFLLVECDGGGGAKIDFSHNSPEQHGTEGSCEGLYASFDYQRVAASGQGEALVRSDIKKFVESSASCRQTFTYHCHGALQDYQCIGDGKTPMKDFTSSDNCGHNDYTWRQDSGEVTESASLPITKWWFGDTGDSNEKDRLDVGPLHCQA